MRGRFGSGTPAGAEAAAPEREWVAAEVFRRLRSRSLAKARAAVQAVPASAFVRLVLDLQDVAAGAGAAALEGTDGVAQVIAQFEGVFLPAAAWEGHVLPARVRDYRPAMLDELVASGDVHVGGKRPRRRRAGRWRRSDARPAAPPPRPLPSAGLVAFFPTDSPLAPVRSEVSFGQEGVASFDAVGRPCNAEDAEAGQAVVGQAVAEALAGGGLFFRQIADAVRRRLAPERVDEARIAAALWELVWDGRATNDTFAPVRAFGRRRLCRPCTHGSAPPRQQPARPPSGLRCGSRVPGVGGCRQVRRGRHACRRAVRTLVAGGPLSRERHGARGGAGGVAARPLRRAVARHSPARRRAGRPGNAHARAAFLGGRGRRAAGHVRGRHGAGAVRGPRDGGRAAFLCGPGRPRRRRARGAHGRAGCRRPGLPVRRRPALAAEFAGGTAQGADEGTPDVAADASSGIRRRRRRVRSRRRRSRQRPRARRRPAGRPAPRAAAGKPGGASQRRSRAARHGGAALPARPSPSRTGRRSKRPPAPWRRIRPACSCGTARTAHGRRSWSRRSTASPSCPRPSPTSCKRPGSSACPTACACTWTPSPAEPAACTQRTPCRRPARAFRKAVFRQAVRRCCRPVR